MTPQSVNMNIDTAAAPSALVAYTERDFMRLRESGLQGAFLRVYEGGGI